MSVELNGMVCTVQEINLRTSIVLTRDDKYIRPTSRFSKSIDKLNPQVQPALK
jgi:hypothetical protein